MYWGLPTLIMKVGDNALLISCIQLWKGGWGGIYSTFSSTHIHFYENIVTTLLKITQKQFTLKDSLLRLFTSSLFNQTIQGALELRNKEKKEHIDFF